MRGSELPGGISDFALQINVGVAKVRAVMGKDRRSLQALGAEGTLITGL